MSRTPVWDTMRRLESEGLVNTVPRHGVFVLNYGADQIRDLFAVRGALEALAVRQAAQNLDDDARGPLEAAAKEMERAAGAGEIEHYSRAAIDFHDRVLVAARNPVLSRLLENVYAQILVLRLRSLYLPERVESSVAEHREIFEAILAGDAERGERLARAHAEHVLQDALEFTRRRPDGSAAPLMSAPAGTPWDRYAAALPTIAAAVGRTPLVRLNRITRDVKPAIYVKVEWYGATGSLKDRIYLHMFERAEARGDLKPGMQVLECSTGNAGIACAWVSAVKGYPCTIVMPEGMSDERKKIMRAYGAELVFTPGGESDVDLSLERLRADPRRGARALLGAGPVRQPGQRRGPHPHHRPRALGAVGRPHRGLRGLAGLGRAAHRRRALPPEPRPAGEALRGRARRVRAALAPRVGPPRHRGHRRRLRAPQPGRLAAHRGDHHHHRGERGHRPAARRARKASSAASRAAATWPPRSSSPAGTPSCRRW